MTGDGPRGGVSPAHRPQARESGNGRSGVDAAPENAETSGRRRSRGSVEKGLTEHLPPTLLGRRADPGRPQSPNRPEPKLPGKAAGECGHRFTRKRVCICTDTVPERVKATP